MDFETESGKLLSIDLEKWTITKNRTCKIIDEIDDDYLLENKSGQVVKKSKSLIRDNKIAIIDSHVNLGEAMYEHWFLKEQRFDAKNRMNEIFNQNIELILSSKELVLSKAEYYLLRPSYLSSGGSVIGGFSYSLGALIDSFQSGNHFVLNEWNGFKELYLINVSGSPLSGAYRANFWADEASKVVSVHSGKPMPSFFSLIKACQKIAHKNGIIIDYQDKAIEQLMEEIHELK